MTISTLRLICLTMDSLVALFWTIALSVNQNISELAPLLPTIVLMTSLSLDDLAGSLFIGLHSMDPLFSS